MGFISADWIISTGILISIGLAFWAKMSNQTIKELLTDIRDFIQESKEEGTEIVYYD